MRTGLPSLTSVTIRTLLTAATLILAVAAPAPSQEIARPIFPEQRRIEVRPPTAMPRAYLPRVAPPPTVSAPRVEPQRWNLSLDDAIRTALANSEVVRVLAGSTAASSGRTLYDPAVSNTQIDQARGRFDPRLDVQNHFNRTHLPGAEFDAGAPSGVRIDGDRTLDYNVSAGVAKTGTTGGTAGVTAYANPAHTGTNALPLNPRTRSSLELSFTQPLLRGGGRGANLAPIELARIDTERSFYQLKDSVGELVRGTIDAYWQLVAARTEAWARWQQVEQGKEALRRTEARQAVGLADDLDAAEHRSVLANFEAGRITAATNLLQREAALRNILGLPPSGPAEIVPVSPPTTERRQIDWNDLVGLAETYRPDLIELKLVVEAGEQRLLTARNNTLPQVDAVAAYRFNSLEGRTPDRSPLSTGPGEFTGWQLGVTLSVPLGTRQDRAVLRQEELLLMRDRANLQEGLHQAVHTLATTYRSQAQFYEQYEAFKRARGAARTLLEGQAGKRRAEGTPYVNYRLALSDWGNAASAESRALTQYNTELATLQQQTGTILEAHGIQFVEERYGSIGPLGRPAANRCYPMGRRPTANADRYKTTNEPAEKVFGVGEPLPLSGQRTPRGGNAPPSTGAPGFLPRGPGPIPPPLPGL
ncbi:MAG: TolC family protein [Candidatus Nealsonbacteria bacterium]|nr:TolC family protein [Candidatus Nealsonbacteria bacterium]